MQQWALLLLAATILANTSIALVMRAAQKRHANGAAVGMVSYLSTAIVYLAIGLLTMPQGSLTAIVYGAIGGFFNVVIFLLLLSAMNIKGVAISIAMIRLGVVVPVVAAIVVWNESPSSIQATGIALALLTLPLLSLDSGVNSGRLTVRQMLVLLGLFLGNGMTLLMMKAFQTTGYTAASPFYLGAAFFVGAVGCGLVFVRAGRPLHGSLEIKWGLLLALSNGLTKILILITLNVLLASVMFPIMAAVGLSLATAFAAVVWREIPGRLGWAGVCLAVAAVVLVNM